MNISHRLPPLSDTQMEIMNVVWDRREAALGDIWIDLSLRRPVAKNTVQTILTRLVEKGWVKTRMVGKTYLYSPAVGRERCVRDALKKFIGIAFGGSTEGLMTALLGDKSLSKEEADRIRELIEQAERRKQK